MNDLSENPPRNPLEDTEPAPVEPDVQAEEDARRRFRRLVDSSEEGQPDSDQAAPQEQEQNGAADASFPYEPLPAGNAEPAQLLYPTPAPPELRRVPPPPPAGTTPAAAQPALDANGMPLPRRVDEIDMDATRVSPIAFDSIVRTPPAGRSRGTPTQPGQRAHAAAAPPARRSGANAPPADNGFTTRAALGCMIRLGIVGAFLFVIAAIIVVAFMVREYMSVAASLPSVDDLYSRASQFETTRILDRDGRVLYEILDPNAGRRTYIPLSRISPYLVAATIATEDKNYYSHPGFDPLAIVRAFWQNWRNDGETVSGASTITQQLARLLLFSPEERYEQTYRRKVREALAAAEITRRYSKDEILELYLNEIYYGALSYGIQAAAETYFETTADQLTLGQAAFLAGLPQAPSIYDIHNNRDATLVRMQQVLTLLFETSMETSCIYVSNSPQRVCIERDPALAAYAEVQNYPFKPPTAEMRYPHWVNYVRLLLESQYDAQRIYRSGFTVYTTIDPTLQDAAERIVSQQVGQLEANNAFNGALVAIRPADGEILAMVGSADFYSEAIDGQVNMAVSPTRQPGSSIKPFSYLAAFEKGWTPATLIWDVQSEFPPSGDPNDPRPPYIPVNYSGSFHGPVTVRAALANSYNIPAVKSLQFVGVYDNPDTPAEEGLVAMMRRVGISSLTRNDYGLALSLGGGEVSLLELTGAYAVLANAGTRLPPVAITKILDYQGQLVYEHQSQPQQVVRAEHAYLITSILSDNNARTPAFGANSLLNLPFPAAAKTGTTNDFRDNWTMGFTADLAVGVWVGNADYTPMVNTTGVTGAAPIWSEFMQAAMLEMNGSSPTPFVRPAGIVDKIICSVSGAEPSDKCPAMRNEIFAADQPPLPKEQDLWMRAEVDTWTGLRASPACQDFVKVEDVINVTDPWAIAWLTQTDQGRGWAQENGFKDPLRFVPARECRADDPRPYLTLSNPTEGQMINTMTLDVFGRADASADFQNFYLYYGLGSDPGESDWKVLLDRSSPVSQVERFYTWDLLDTFADGGVGSSAGKPELPNGPVTLRLYMRSTRNTYAELKVRLNFQLPTPTPTMTPTATPSPTASSTPLPLPSETPTLLPPVFPTDTPTLPPPVFPTDSPTLPVPVYPTETETSMPEPTATPTETVTP